MNKTEEIIEQLVREAGFKLKQVTPLTPDASLRRYFRLSLQEGAPVVAMLFDSVRAAEVGEGEVVESDTAYVAFTHYFLSKGLPVPKLLAVLSGAHALLLEDFGDTLLGSELLAKGSSSVREKFFEAVELIAKLQALSLGQGLPYRRAFSSALFLDEMREFLDFYLPGEKKSADVAVAAGTAMHRLAEELSELPFRLAHRDFHAWNLMCKPSGELGVIDFQDALLAPYPYDLISLLNDRDTDSALGEALSSELMSRFSSLIDAPKARFSLDCTRTLLQRDLKVVGRFAKLNQERGLSHYLQWIPGTMRRVERGLKLLSTEDEVYANFYLKLFGDKQ